MNLLNRILYYNLDAYFIFVLSLSNFVDEPGSDEIVFDDVVVREYTDDDFDVLINFICANQNFGKTEREAKIELGWRFAHDYHCVIALVGGQVIGMGWFCISSQVNWPDFARFPDLPEKSGLLLTDFVQINYRGRGIHKAILTLRKKFIKDKGLLNAISFVGVKNFSSVRNYLYICDYYRLTYYLSINFPKGIKFSTFLNKKREKWMPEV